jgi:dUTP pyrophosphatase
MILNIKIVTEHEDFLQEKYSDSTNTNFYTEDSGFDVYFPEDITIQPNESKNVKLGISCEAFRNQADKEAGRNCAFYLYPRSSISRTPLRMANSVGIIDSGYRGELMVVVDNINHTDTGSYTIQRGQRLFQICAPDLAPYDNVQIVQELSSSSRGTGGFGSTGSN